MTVLQRVILYLVGAGLLAYLVVSWYDSAIEAAEDRGRMAERLAWEKKEAKRVEAERLALRQRAADNAAEKARQDALNVKVTKDHENALAELRKNIARQDIALASAGGLRVAADCDGPTGPAQTAGDGNDDAWIAATRALPPEVDRDIRATVDEAERVLAQAREAQAWICAHGFYPCTEDDLQPQESPLSP
ncbi:hypothetical protein [Cupriavidus pauculus]|uniref:hypothetical protein n=1 Tax=Cupriavidus pauculus TaxID=82633 RepID=UPI001D0CAA08|nr:hypothetical protein [Cupriavidus pauculus]